MINLKPGESIQTGFRIEMIWLNNQLNNFLTNIKSWKVEKSIDRFENTTYQILSS